MTKCTTKPLGSQLNFCFGLGKPVVGAFDGGRISSDGGVMLLRQADNRLGLCSQVAMCLGEKRRPDLVRHDLVSLVRQRVYGIAAGYEDGNDSMFLRNDPMHKLAVGRLPETGGALASQASVSRFENSVKPNELGFLQDLLVHLYVQKKRKAPKQIVLDIDTTCDEVHGYQQLSFYNGFYGTYCFTPMFVFDQDGFPLAALLRPGNAAPAERAVSVLRRIVAILRSAWPGVGIELRADAGFCVPELYEFCESAGVTYFIGLKSNPALDYHGKQLVAAAKSEFEETSQAAPLVHSKAQKTLVRLQWRQKEERIRFASREEGRMQEHMEDLHEQRLRKFSEFRYAAKEWTKERRIIARCDYTWAGPEIRYIITNSSKPRPKWLYEEKYCKRGQCENWIKELKMLHCDRLSCQEFEANQFRLLLHTFAYILLQQLRVKKDGIISSMDTIRLRLLKIGVRVTESARRVVLSFASEHPWQEQFCALVVKLL